MNVQELERLHTQAGKERVHVPSDEKDQDRCLGCLLHGRCRDRLLEVPETLRKHMSVNDALFYMTVQRSSPKKRYIWPLRRPKGNHDARQPVKYQAKPLQMTVREEMSVVRPSLDWETKATCCPL